MDESRRADAPGINPATASRIPVRSISLAIVVAVVLYVGMATLADWEAFGAAVSVIPGALWAQVEVLSLLSDLLQFSCWHPFIVALGRKVPILRNLDLLGGVCADTHSGQVWGDDSIDLSSSLRHELSTQYRCIYRGAAGLGCSGGSGATG
ncbi:hypothetical protein HEQ60_03605 [Haematospirillum sp. H1815]|uniref:hypothetical protein n=1 Tax=Haematospirillum sp. H1815 TaxID=2723108 RepID=UPI00143A1B0F|nr:hypothetical protein [Haematospirillum sp. H1815]NKD76851.1 hypothetical protein [Haematospirillum sp. H1815]